MNLIFHMLPSTTDEVYPETCSAQCTHVWRALNPATRRAYGYGGVKLFAREAFFDKAWVHFKFPGVDVTSEVARRGFHIYQDKISQMKHVLILLL